jgi:hypothetical protein
MAGMAPRAGPVPRRARHLIPTGLPRRGELIAVGALAVLVAHLLLAQLTLVLAVPFAVVAKTSRWRPWWLLAPAVAGLVWTLAVGPANALAGFAAGPASILRHLGGGRLAGQPWHPLAGFGGAGNWLPRQFPVALISGAAEAALIGWLDWLHTDEWAVPPPRPGVIAAARRAIATRAIRAGTVVTREGTALGVDPATGAIAELRWAEVTRGVLVVGAAERDVTLAGLQVVHAALRRRKPVIVLDSGDVGIAHALEAACAATGTSLLAGGSSQGGGSVPVAAGPAAGGRDAEAGASELWGRTARREGQPGDWQAVDLGRVVRERSAAFLRVDSAELAARACADLASLARDLRRIGVDGDALVWLPRGELAPARALAELVRDGQDAGLAVVAGTTSPAAATELAGLAGTVLVYRLVDPDLAASLASRTGSRLLPRALAAALAGPRGGDRWPAVPAAAGSGYPAATAYPAAPAAATSADAAVTDLVPTTVIAARTLLTLGQAEFVLAVSQPRPRIVAPGRRVPARLPRTAARRPVPQQEPP